MANHKSAQKRAIQNDKRRENNRIYSSRVRTAVKKFRTAASNLKAGQVKLEQVTKLFAEAQSLLCKAAGKRVIHPNNASRSVARLSALLRKSAG